MMHSSTPRMQHRAESPPPCYSVRILVVGDSAVGKTSLLEMLSANSGRSDVAAAAARARADWTLGCSASVIRESVEVDFVTTEVEVELLEIGGAQSHASARTVFYEGLDAIVLVYDVSNKKTYHRLVLWLFELCTCVLPPSLRYWDGGGGSGGVPDLECARDRSFARGIFSGRYPSLFVANKCDLRPPGGPREVVKRPDLPERPPLLDRLLGFGQEGPLGAQKPSPADAALLERLREFILQGRHTEASVRTQTFDQPLWRDFIRRAVEAKRRSAAE